MRNPASSWVMCWAARVAVVVAAASAFGCSNPCDRLLKKLCDCPGERAKLACTEAKDRRAKKDAEARDKDKCRAALEKLRCEDLK